VAVVYRIEAAAEHGNAAIVTALFHTQSRWARKSEYSLASSLPDSGFQS
jgi:hypothetical protein